MDSRFIYNHIGNCREIIANYLRSSYQLEPLTYKNNFLSISIMKVYFYSDTNNWRLEIVSNRNSQTL